VSEHEALLCPELLQGQLSGPVSEYGVLEEVLVASPQHLSIVPCNRVSEDALEKGHLSCTVRAKAQHRSLVAELTDAGVRVLTVKPVANLPDLAFTRDSTLMTPWGLVGLRPGATHRRGEVEVVLQAARAAALPILGRIKAGCIEGGDVCLLRPGYVAIGISGQRTDRVGAQALGTLFEGRGWKVIHTPVDPDLLHLDTHFCMLDRNLALGCVEKLDHAFLEEVDRLGIKVVPVRADEVADLGCNVLSLGRHRIITAGSAPRVDQALRELGFAVRTLALDEFTQCGGGVHCLTMPLQRSSSAA
jgi:N-dimethylarginine dimethylaminohydrolase